MIEASSTAPLDIEEVIRNARKKSPQLTMCNFFTRHREPRNLQAAFKFPELPNDPPRYVVRPTCAPNRTVAPIHDRMPVLFTREAEWDAWLHPNAIPDELRKMLAPTDDALLEAVPVSRDLLRTKEPGPELLAPVGGR